jgi:hypothetical protein
MQWVGGYQSLEGMYWRQLGRGVKLGSEWLYSSQQVEGYMSLLIGLYRWYDYAVT